MSKTGRSGTTWPFCSKPLKWFFGARALTDNFLIQFTVFIAVPSRIIQEIENNAANARDTPSIKTHRHPLDRHLQLRKMA